MYNMLSAEQAVRVDGLRVRKAVKGRFLFAGRAVDTTVRAAISLSNKRLDILFPEIYQRFIQNSSPDVLMDQL